MTVLGVMSIVANRICRCSLSSSIRLRTRDPTCKHTLSFFNLRLTTSLYFHLFHFSPIPRGRRREDYVNGNLLNNNNNLRKKNCRCTSEWSSASKKTTTTILNKMNEAKWKQTYMRLFMKEKKYNKIARNNHGWSGV